jgi:integrase
MRKTSFALSKCSVHGSVRYCVTAPRADGPGRQRRFFTDKVEAKTFLELKRAEIARHGIRALGLGEQDRADFLWCAEQLRPYSLSVRQAVELLLPQLRAREHGLSVAEGVKRLLESKRAAGLSERHLYSLENRLSRFAADHAGRSLASFTLRDVEQWLNALPVGAQTANHYKAALHSLFGYGVKLGACVANPVSGIDSRKVIRPAPSILTPTQLSALLTACTDDAEMLAFVAVGAFAGLRCAEIERLRWQDVNLSRGFITVGAQNAKTGKRRLVPVCAALREWLKPVAKTAGPLAPTMNFRRRFHAVRQSAGLLAKWEGNELRHSYASFRLAETQNAAQTALELGNSPTVLQAHYKELATPEDAALWFAVKPVRAHNLVSFAAA